MATLNGLKLKYERHYLIGIMYLAKGETTLAEKYFLMVAKELKEYIPWLAGDELDETKELLLEIVAHLKNISNAKNEIKNKDSAVKEGENESFMFKKEEIPNISFDDVIGLDSVKEQINDMIILPRKHRGLYERFKKKLGGGIIMYGPPGNGKTMIARAIAHETGSDFFPIKFSDLGSKWFGETEQHIKALFEQARKQESAVIFFDEIDSIAPARGGDTASGRVVSELLAQMDGINRLSGNITILAATNRIDDIDSAILRPGRFDEKIYVPLPDVKGRAAMFKKRLKEVPCERIAFNEIAKLCEGFSGAEIEHICEKAKQKVIRSIIDGAPDDTRITKQDLIDTIGLINRV